MKICIITFSCAFNYGAMLQTYALYQVLKSKGNDVKVIDYITERYNLDSKDYADKFLATTRIWKKSSILKWIWKHTRFSDMKINRNVFRKFLEENINLTRSYFSEEELKKNVPLADIYITGSDQVWNPDFLWNKNIDTPYYLDFAPVNAKRISYASSFGKDKLTKEEADMAEPLLKKYNFLSVREESGIHILANMELASVEVVDPTILAGLEYFNNLIPKRCLYSQKYMLLFQIHFNDKLFQISKWLAKKYQIELLVIIPDISQHIRYRHNVIILPTVNEWLWYMMHAEFVITDSFHASAFSIIMHKNFVSSSLSGYNGRIYNILKRLGLEMRLLKKLDKAELDNIYIENIDYSNIDHLIEIWREESEAWLLNAIKNS